MSNISNELLDELSPKRRSFVQTIIGMAGYSVPSVRTFVIGATVALSRPPVLYAVATTNRSIPEIGPDSVGPALTLLAGGALLVREHAKKHATKTETSSGT